MADTTIPPFDEVRALAPQGVTGVVLQQSLRDDDGGRYAPSVRYHVRLEMGEMVTRSFADCDYSGHARTVAVAVARALDVPLHDATPPVARA